MIFTSLVKLVNAPTSCTPTAANILDLVLTSNSDRLFDISVIPDINRFIKSRPRPPRKAYDYKRGNIEGYKGQINNSTKHSYQISKVAHLKRTGSNII